MHFNETYRRESEYKVRHLISPLAAFRSSVRIIHNKYVCFFFLLLNKRKRIFVNYFISLFFFYRYERFVQRDSTTDSSVLASQSLTHSNAHSHASSITVLKYVMVKKLKRKSHFFRVTSLWS